MGFLLDKCKLKKMDDEILSTCHPFTCGDEDLDDFFLHDAMRYKGKYLLPLHPESRKSKLVNGC